MAYFEIDNMRGKKRRRVWDNVHKFSSRTYYWCFLCVDCSPIQYISYLRALAGILDRIEYRWLLLLLLLLNQHRYSMNETFYWFTLYHHLLMFECFSQLKAFRFFLLSHFLSFALSIIGKVHTVNVYISQHHLWSLYLRTNVCRASLSVCTLAFAYVCVRLLSIIFSSMVFRFAWMFDVVHNDNEYAEENIYLYLLCTYNCFGRALSTNEKSICLTFD